MAAVMWLQIATLLTIIIRGLVPVVRQELWQRSVERILSRVQHGTRLVARDDAKGKSIEISLEQPTPTTFRTSTEPDHAQDTGTASCD